MDKLSELGDIDTDSKEKQTEEFIISEVCKHFLVDKSEVTKSKVLGDALVARDMCAIMLTKHLGYSNSKVAVLLKKDGSQITRTWNRFTRMNRKVKHEAEFLDSFSELNKVVITYKNQIKLI